MKAACACTAPSYQHYFNGVEFKHIAELLGVSKGRVSQLHRAALEKVRARLRLSD